MLIIFLGFKTGSEKSQVKSWESKAERVKSVWKKSGKLNKKNRGKISG